MTKGGGLRSRSGVSVVTLLRRPWLGHDLFFSGADGAVETDVRITHSLLVRTVFSFSGEVFVRGVVCGVYGGNRAVRDSQCLAKPQNI